MSNFVACDSIDVNGTSYQGIVTTTYDELVNKFGDPTYTCLLYTSPSPRDVEESRMPSSA